MIPVDRYASLLTDPYRESLLERVTELLECCHSATYRLLDHALAVAHVAQLLAEATGLPEPLVRQAWLAGYLHDAGKVLVSNSIHFKPGPLTSEERAVMRRHPELGASLIASLELPDVVAAVRHHHERVDGSGYPSGLSGKTIPPLARLIAVADHYAALREERCYRAGHGHDQALHSCYRAAASHQLDLTLVNRLSEIRQESLRPLDPSETASSDRSGGA